MPRTTLWFARDNQWTNRHVAACSELFSSDNPNMPDIVNAQRALLNESHRREDTSTRNAILACDDRGGDSLLTVVHPCHQCDKDNQWFDTRRSLCRSENPSNDADVRACASFGMREADIRVHCIPVDSAPAPTTEERRSPPRSDMECRACAGSTRGPCKHARTGECTNRGVGGTCPDGYVSCIDVPCQRVDTPCYDPLTHACLPPKSSDVSYANSACPSGTAKQERVGWKVPFEPHPLQHQLRNRDGGWFVRNDPRTRMPPTSLR